MHYSYNTNKYNMTNKLDILGDIDNLSDSLSSIFLVTSVMIFYTFAIYLINEYLTNHKYVTIVRGMPGSGKSNLDMRDGRVINVDDYILKQGMTMREAHFTALMDCLRYVSGDCYYDNSKSIYIVGTFSKHWEVLPFQEIAKSFEFRYRLVEMPTLDLGEATHFFNKSKYKSCEFNADWQKWFLTEVYPSWEEMDCTHQMETLEVEPESPRPKLRRFAQAAEDILNHTRENTRYNLRRRRRVVYS